MNRKFNVITKLQRISDALGFGEMEENFTDDIAALDKTKALFKGTHNPLVTNWVSRILQTDITSSQVTAFVGKNKNEMSNFQTNIVKLNLIVTCD